MNKPFAPLSREEIAIRALGLRRDPLAGELIALEPRMVFDGAGLAVATDAAKQASDAADAVKTDTSGKSTADAAAELAKTIAEAAVPPAQPASTPVEVVFIDSRVADIDAFKKTAGDNRLVVVVDAAEDGITKITDTLKGLHDVSAVHIVGHGVEGSFELGKDWIGVEAIKAHDADIKSWTQSLAVGADILLYGCDVAKGTDGDTLIKTLAQETGRDVAASADAVGLTEHGADWTLEKTTGTIEAKALAPVGYAYELAVSAEITDAKLVDDTLPNTTGLTGSGLALNATYDPVTTGLNNSTNDPTPSFRSNNATNGAILRLYLYDSTDKTRTLVGAAVGPTVTYGSAGTTGLTINATPLTTTGKLHFAITQQEVGKKESQADPTNSSLSHIWINYDVDAPPALSSSSVFLYGGTANVVDKTVTQTVSTRTTLYTVLLSAAQKSALSLSSADGKSTVYIGGFIKAYYFDATTNKYVLASVGVTKNTVDASGNAYLTTAPLSWTPTDTTRSFSSTQTYYFFVCDSSGNYIDAKGNKPDTSGSIDVPKDVTGVASLTIAYQILGAPTVTSIKDSTGPKTGDITNANTTTDELRPIISGTGANGTDVVLVLRVSQSRMDGSGSVTTSYDPSAAGFAKLNPNYRTTVNADGTWTIDIGKNLDPNYKYKVSVIQKNVTTGLTSNSSTQFEFNVDTNAPDFAFVDNVGSIQNSNLSAFSLVDAVTLKGSTGKGESQSLTIDLEITSFTETRAANGSIIDTPIGQPPRGDPVVMLVDDLV